MAGDIQATSFEPPRDSGDLSLADWSATLQPPALALAPDILSLAAGEVADAGVAGEQRLVKTLYLALTSRLLDRPCSVAVKGPSAGGKSFVVEQVLRLFPEEAYFSLTGMSEHALAYDQTPLAHRMIVVYEAVGLAGDFASYLMRSLLSEGRIDYVTVDRGKDGLRSRHIVRPGPTGLITTTTAVNLHAENETRLLSVTVNDTPEQTRQIMLAHALDLQVVRDPTPWREYQIWLADQPTDVAIPFGRFLAESIQPLGVRLRRDFTTLLTLTRAHCLLHQVNRGRDDAGRLIADLSDYDAVRTLVADLFSEGVERTVSTTIRETVQAVTDLAPNPMDSVLTGDGVTVAAVAARLHLDKSSTWRRVQVAQKRGYLRNLETRRGQPAQLVLGDPLPDGGTLLPTTAELERLQGCSPEPTHVNTDVEDDYPRSAWDGDLPPAPWGWVQ